MVSERIRRAGTGGLVARVREQRRLGSILRSRPRVSVTITMAILVYQVGSGQSARDPMLPGRALNSFQTLYQLDSIQQRGATQLSRRGSFNIWTGDRRGGRAGTHTV